VALGAEMMTIMSALRQAQSGQHLMNTYDDLMGRAITTFGQG
jgi:flagellar basal body rod protein FlgG